MDFYYISDDVLRLSLLTLIYRAAPRESGTSTFSGSCLDAARATLARHQDCMAVVDRCGGAYLSTYVNW